MVFPSGANLMYVGEGTVMTMPHVHFVTIPSFANSRKERLLVGPSDLSPGQKGVHGLHVCNA